MSVKSETNQSRDARDLATRYVLDFDEIDRTHVAIVGGKGSNLGELSRIDGVRVPAGFCVTTDAFRRAMAAGPSLGDLLEQLSRVGPDDQESTRALSASIRQTIEHVAIPDDVANAVTHAITKFGERDAYAVRSSATAEDSPTVSFAGQQDTYLNISGTAAILQHVSRCWASLLSERAVTYRLRNGIDHRQVQMAVVVQRMVFPRASGILFTADPVTGNRKVVSIDASFGLGEALVAGLVNADVYKVRVDEIITKTIATKRLAIQPLPAGGTHQQPIDTEQQAQPALTDAQVMRLAQLGRRIEAHFGRPQDIEWCLVDDDFQIVQSRPITTLFPPPVVGDQENHVYLSVGHQQMMTDAVPPLAISIRQLTGATTFYESAGRLFVDVSRALASPAGRAGLLALAGKSDPLTGDALRTIMARDFIPVVPDEATSPSTAKTPPAPIATDSAIVAELIAQGRASIDAMKREIHTYSGSPLFDFVLTDMQELKRLLMDRQSHQAIMAGTEATWWLNEHVEEWLGEKNAADILSQSVDNNVTSEMGLELLHVADVIRPYPAVVTFLQQIDNDFLNELPTIPGGQEARDAIQSWLDKYGMRCVGEIDISRPRWSEQPSTLVPLILSNIRNFQPGAGELRFAQGLEAARNKEAELLERLRALPDGERKAAEVKHMIDRLRTFIGYREYPKYFMINRYFEYRLALLAEADRLVEKNVLRDRDDIFFLTFQELHDVVRAEKVDYSLIDERKGAFREFQTLTPPRVLTSDGEIIMGSYRREDFPADALVGLAVSSGTVEGRARVILDVASANLEPGDILVTPFTDPSWTPLFVAIRGLVTEVGGLMTHGAVIAREYGLPAVVSVEGATRLIKDGQRIRVNGTDGYVEILE
jgi:pyruvate,water dikinase